MEINNEIIEDLIEAIKNNMVTKPLIMQKY